MPQQSTIIYKKTPIESDYELGNQLGRGAFSVVKHAISKTTGQEYAVKVVPKKSVREINSVQNEITILSHTNHPNIIKLYDVYETEDSLSLVMELIAGGELYADVVSAGPYDERKVFLLFNQLVDAVSYLHSLRIAHRDLKLENVLVTENWQIKLTDFGLSKMLEPGEVFMKSRCGTPAYVAPEVIQGLDYTSMVDNWALGVIMYLLLMCCYPFNGSSLSDIYDSILEGKIKFDDNDISISAEGKDLISKLLVADPAKRYTLEQLKQHPWMVKYASLCNKTSLPCEDISITTPPITIVPSRSRSPSTCEASAANSNSPSPTGSASTSPIASSEFVDPPKNDFFVQASSNISIFGKTTSCSIEQMRQHHYPSSDLSFRSASFGGMATN